MLFLFLYAVLNRQGQTVAPRNPFNLSYQSLPILPTLITLQTWKRDTEPTHELDAN